MIYLLAAYRVSDAVLEEIAEFHCIKPEEIVVRKVRELGWYNRPRVLSRFMRRYQKVSKVYTDVAPAFIEALTDKRTVGLVSCLSNGEIMVYSAAAGRFDFCPEMSVESPVRVEAVA